MNLSEVTIILNDIVENLSTVPLFQHIEKSDLPSMLKCLGSSQRAYNKDEFLLYADDPIDFIGVVLSGRIQMIKEDYRGNRFIYMEIQSSEIFGETFICGPNSPCPVSFKAATKCDILIMPFQKILHTCSLTCAFHQRLIENMVYLIAQKNLVFTNKLEIISNKSIRDRLLTYLFQLSKAQQSNRITISLNRTELADYLSVDRSALSREIQKLIKDKILTAEKNIFALHF